MTKTDGRDGKVPGAAAPSSRRVAAAGESASSWEFMGMPALQWLALAGAVIASIVSFETTWSGFRRFYGDRPGVAEVAGPLLISILVQSGIFFASLYLSKRFVHSKTRVRGARETVNVSRSLTYLIVLLLIPLAGFSIFFSYCTFYDRLLDPTIKYNSRLDRAREDSVLVLDRLKGVVQDEERRISRAVLDSTAFKTWDKSITQLVTAAAGSGDKIDAFLSSRQEEAARRLQQQQRLRTEVAARKIDIEARLRAAERDIARAKAEIPQAEQRLAAAEQESIAAEPEIQRLAKELKEEKERGREGRAPGEGKIFRSLKERHDKLVDTKKVRDAAEKDVTALKKTLAEKEGQREVIQSEAKQAGLQLSSQDVKASDLDASVDLPQALLDLKPRRLQVASDLKAAQDSLNQGFDAKVYAKAIADCRTLHRPLSRLDGVAADLANVECEAARDLVPAVRALEEHQKTMTVFYKKGCDSLPARPADAAADEAAVGRLVRELGQYTADCVQASGLSAKPDTRRQIAAINAEIGKIQRTQGTGVDYLTEMSNYLAAGDRSAVMSMALAAMIDGLVFVLAFFGELVKVRIEDSAPVPALSEHDRARLRRAMTELTSTTDSRLDVPRQLVQALRWNEREGAYQLDSSAIRNAAVYNQIMAAILPTQAAGRAWVRHGKAGSTTHFISERGLYEIMTSMEEAVAAAEERETVDETGGQEARAPAPVSAAKRAPSRSPPPESGGGYYKYFFDQPHAAGDGPKRQAPSSGPRRWTAGSSDREGTERSAQDGDPERAARAYEERHRRRKP